MTATVFVWEMYKKGVGHASMYVEGAAGRAYISWWPAPGEGVKRALNGISSPGLVHSMSRDKSEDGIPDWASKPLRDLNEKAIVGWWKTIAATPNLRTHEEAAKSGQYVFTTNNCSTTVLRALRLGANDKQRSLIDSYMRGGGSIAQAQQTADDRIMGLAANLIGAGTGTLGGAARSYFETFTADVKPRNVVAPFDVRYLVEKIWG